MLTFAQVITRARHSYLPAILGATLLCAATAWAQTETPGPTAANHAVPKVMTPVSLPSPADQAELPAPTADAPLAAEDGQQKPKPTQTPRPAPRGNRDTQGEGGRYGDANFVGEPINLNVVDADLRDVLNYITEQYGVNFVIDNAVAKDAPKISVNINNVPWNIALDAILSANQLGVDVKGPLLRIASAKSLADESDRTRALEAARRNNQPLYTEVIRLNYARPTGALINQSEGTAVFKGGDTTNGAGSASSGGGGGGILPIIQRRLSSNGSVEFDGRTNSLIVTDVKENVAAVRQLVELLDKPEPQVEIEARIVIASRKFSRDLGVQLSALALGSRGSAGSGNRRRRAELRTRRNASTLRSRLQCGSLPRQGTRPERLCAVTAGLRPGVRLLGDRRGRAWPTRVSGRSRKQLIAAEGFPPCPARWR